MAEVLITLAIVGVIASMTVPSLIQSNNGDTYKKQATVAYNILYHALNKMKLDHPDIIGEYSASATPSEDDFIKYFEVVKDCGASCVPNAAGDADPSAICQTYNNGTGASTNILKDYQFLINNGMLVMLYELKGLSLIYISVDINGHLKKPNVYGKDVFSFQLRPYNSLKPMEAPGTFFSTQNTYCK